MPSHLGSRCPSPDVSRKDAQCWISLLAARIAVVYPTGLLHLFRTSMRVGLFIDVCLRPNPSGVGKHLLGLLVALVRHQRELKLFLYCSRDFWQRDAWPDELLDALNDSDARVKRTCFSSDWIDDRPRLWWEAYLPMLLIRDRIDVFHGVNHRVPFVLRPLRRWKNVVTIHDMAFAYMPVHGRGLDAYLLRNTLKSIDHSDAVICVSKATADDCASLSGRSRDFFDVVYQGFESASATKARRPIKMKSDRQFALMVGGLHPRKNVPVLIRAFAGAALEASLDLVVAGGDGDDASVVRCLIDELDVAGRVHLLGYVSDHERQWLYNNALMVVYPSRYEGFGLVILEAMRAGVPVITSDVSAMPEAAGGAAVLVSPDDENELKRAIVRIASDVGFRDGLKELGLVQAQRFSWCEAAKQTAQSYSDAGLQQGVSR